VSALQESQFRELVTNTGTTISHDFLRIYLYPPNCAVVPMGCEVVIELFPERERERERETVASTISFKDNIIEFNWSSAKKVHNGKGDTEMSA
jgi:hypothetical protein